MPAWVVALLATLAIQATAAMILRAIPTLGPELTSEAGIGANTVGYLGAAGTVASVVLMLAAPPFIRRYGSIRTLQAGLVVGAIGLLVALVPHWTTLLLASVLLGAGYAPSSPAGADVLRRTAPAGHQALIFSVKQAGVPVGGVISGLVLPFVAERFGWQAALLVMLAMTLVVIVAVQQPRRAIDAVQDRTATIALSSVLSARVFLAPFRTLSLYPRLVPLSVAGFCFAVIQGVLFTFIVTFAVVVLDMSLTAAGALFAATQVTGIFGRVFLGWLSDRFGSALPVLVILGIADAGTMVAFMRVDATWSVSDLIILASIAGITVSSWNGLHLVEIARTVPQERVAETTASATMLTFLGYVIGPAAFAVVATTAGGFRFGFAVCAALGLVAALAILLLLRQQTKAPLSVN